MYGVTDAFQILSCCCELVRRAIGRVRWSRECCKCSHVPQIASERVYTLQYSTQDNCCLYLFAAKRVVIKYHHIY